MDAQLEDAAGMPNEWCTRHSGGASDRPGRCAMRHIKLIEIIEALIYIYNMDF